MLAPCIPAMRAAAFCVQKSTLPFDIPLRECFGYAKCHIYLCCVWRIHEKFLPKRIFWMVLMHIRLRQNTESDKRSENKNGNSHKNDQKQKIKWEWKTASGFLSQSQSRHDVNIQSNVGRNDALLLLESNGYIWNDLNFIELILLFFFHSTVDTFHFHRYFIIPPIYDCARYCWLATKHT